MFLKNLLQCPQCRAKDNLFQPALSNQELNEIKEPQARIIYDNAKNILKDNHDTLKSLTAKADTLFKYLFAIQTGLCGLFLYSWRLKTVEINIDACSFSMWVGFILFCLPMIIYAFWFLSPVATKGIDNPPINTLTKRATLPLEKFYIFEAIDIQQYAIPFNERCINSRVSALRFMVSSSILAILFLAIAFTKII